MKRAAQFNGKAAPDFRLEHSEPTRSRSKEEEQHCSAFYESLLLLARSRPELELLHHIPNGGSRHVVEAVKLKRMGVKQGVLDYNLPVPRGGFCGLWIEFKSKNGKLSPEQEDFAYRVTQEGHMVIVVRDWLDARNAVIAYLDERPVEVSDHKPRD